MKSVGASDVFVVRSLHSLPLRRSPVRNERRGRFYWIVHPFHVSWIDVGWAKADWRKPIKSRAGSLERTALPCRSTSGGPPGLAVHWESCGTAWKPPPRWAAAGELAVQAVGRLANGGPTDCLVALGRFGSPYLLYANRAQAAVLVLVIVMVADFANEVRRCFCSSITSRASTD